jgi:acid phosphatase type 7
VVAAGRMTFHLVGCSGDASNHQPVGGVVKGMAAQVRDPSAGGAADGLATTASFLYHLGDVIYKPGATSDAESDEPVDDSTVQPDEDRGRMYNDQFYGPFAPNDRPIFAIAGNHDGKYSPHASKSAIDHFFTNFCATSAAVSPDNNTDTRGAMMQPYIYWCLSTPVAYIIGLYSNIANGGILDDPFGRDDGPQYQWLVSELRDMRTKNSHRTQRKAIVLAVHYPPYSGASNFVQRGDPGLGPTNARKARPLGAVLQQAFAQSGQRPDVVVSAHAHLYQRLTYRYADGWELPFLIAGSGGHAPVEPLFKACDGKMEPSRAIPFDAVLPLGLSLPAADSVQVDAYNDGEFGFLRLTIGSNRIDGEFFTATQQSLTCADAFSLDMTSHRLST